MSDKPQVDAPTKSRASLTFWNILLVLAAGAFVYLALFKPTRPAGQWRTQPAVGRQLGDVELTLLTAGNANLPPAPTLSRGELAGKVVLINFWGPWCYYCTQEMPHLVELQKQFSDRPDFRLLPISYSGGPVEDLQTLRADTQEYLSREKFDLVTYADPGGKTLSSLIETAGLHDFGFPTTVLVDRQGIIRGVWLGYEPGSERQMQEAVEELLAKAAS